MRVCLLFALLTELLFAATSPAHGQFRLDIAQLAAATNAVDELEDEPAAPQRPNQFQVQQNINGWLFSQHGNADRAQSFLDRQLAVQVGNYAELFDLSAAQIAKLMLAGQGDIASYFAEVELVRAEFGPTVNQVEFNKVWQRVQPLQLRMQRGLFENDSLLAKVTQRTLDDNQRIQFQAQEKERLAFAYEAAVKLAVAELDRSVFMLESQRKQLLDLLLKTEPPKVLGQYTTYYVLYRLAQEKQQVHEILKPGQRKAISQALNQGQAMEQFLRQNGILD